MPTKEVTIPKFKNEAQEAAWWDANPEVATELMSRAIKAGTAARPALKTVAMRLPVADIQLAQQLAKQKGLPYQTYIKMVLHEALQKAQRL